jgi:hypothetical protein
VSPTWRYRNTAGNGGGLSNSGGIATGNTNVTLRRTVVRNNTPDNCNPLNTIPGCHN